MPDVPTVRESLGSTEYDLTAWCGVFAPARTPDLIANVLSSAMSSSVLSLSDELEKMGVEAQGWPAHKFDAFFRSEIPRWAEVLRVTGVTEQHLTSRTSSGLTT